MDRTPPPAVALADLRAAWAASLAAIDGPLRNQRMRGLVLAFGGTLIERRLDGWSAAEWEVTVLGVTGIGADLTEASADWIKCARRADEEIAA